MIHTELARGRQGVQAPEELHSVTVVLDEDVARQMVSSATGICASSRAGSPPNGHDADAWSDLAKHGVLFNSPRRLMVGLGVAAVLRVPGGAERQAATGAVSRFLDSLGCIDPIRRPGSVRDGLRRAAIRTFSRRRAGRPTGHRRMRERRTVLDDPRRDGASCCAGPLGRLSGAGRCSRRR